MKRLKPRQRRFVDNYVKTSNATQSYQQAGYTQNPNSASADSSRMLKTAKIEEAIEEKYIATGISDELLESVHKQGLTAIKDNGKKDSRTQAIYLDMGYRLKGSYSPEKLSIDNQVNELPLDKLREYRAKLLKEGNN